MCGCCAWCASCPPPETGRPRGPRSPGRVTAQRGGAYGRGVSSMRLGNSHGRGRARAQPGLHVEPLVLQRVFGQHALPRVELHQFRQHVLRLGGDIRVVWVAKLPCDDRLLRRHVGISDERVEAKQRDIPAKSLAWDTTRTSFTLAKCPRPSVSPFSYNCQKSRPERSC